MNTVRKASARLKLLIVSFDFELERRKIPAFRAAVIEKVGRENILFHNHLEQNFRYGYPLIQYKTFENNPTIVCINEGTEEILKFFKQTEWNLILNGKEVNAEIKHLSFDYFCCGFSEELLRYKIENWFALNEANFQRFMQLNNSKERLGFLGRIMVGNILSFAKGIGWNVNQQVKLVVTRLPKQRSFNFKNHQMVGFDLNFISNIVLPGVIGLGKSVSRGFGVIRKVS